MDMSLSKLWELVMDREAWSAVDTGVTKSQTQLSDWTELNLLNPQRRFSHSFPASGSFPMSQFFASGGQSIGASASASVLQMNIQDLFLLGLTGWISLHSKGLSRVFSNTTVQKHQFFSTHLPLWNNSFIHDYWKTRALTRWTFVVKMMFLLFNLLSWLVIAFLRRRKQLLISWLQSPSAVILEPKKIVFHCFHCFPIYLLWSDWTRCHNLHFLNVEF